MIVEKATILVVDDEPSNVSSLEKIFQKEGLDVLTALGGKDALESLRRQRVHVLLTDLKMPGMSGVDLLKAARTVSPETDVILMTAYGTIETAVEAMKEGAYDFVTKPFKRILITRTVRRALEKQSLVFENRNLKAQLMNMELEKQIIGNSMAMRRTMEIVGQAAPSSATVLLQGESGTGKELLARALYMKSARRDRPFVAVNCAALPDTILESELFGYERGAFTGAVARREGRFEAANGGTLFLDEVGEMKPHVQVKLLRVLQEGEFERLGSSQTIKVDIRIVAATNKELQREVGEGRFREDLYYRLNVINIQLPPVRERREDVPLLAEHFLRLYSRKNNKAIMGISREAMDLLMAYSWPGNVRELENTVERAVVLTRNEILGVEDLPDSIRYENQEVQRVVIPIGISLEEVEHRVINETLKHTRGDKRAAAQLLGIATRTIYRKLEDQIQRPELRVGGSMSVPTREKE